MRYFTQFIVLHEDITVPAATEFCKIIWESDDYDSDGDFYFNNINGDWTELDLEDRNDNTIFKVRIYREKSYSGNNEVILSLSSVVQRFFNSEVFKFEEEIIKIDSPAVTSLQIETGSNEKYLDFLNTCHFFLKFTSGVIATSSGYLFNANEFHERFIIAK